MSLFENKNLAIFAGNSQKDSLINYSKIAQKYSLRSCSFESISDVLETGGYTFYSCYALKGGCAT